MINKLVVKERKCVVALRRKSSGRPRGAGGERRAQIAVAALSRPVPRPRAARPAHSASREPYETDRVRAQTLVFSRRSIPSSLSVCRSFPVTVQCTHNPLRTPRLTAELRWTDVHHLQLKAIQPLPLIEGFPSSRSHEEVNIFIHFCVNTRRVASTPSPFQWGLKAPKVAFYTARTVTERRAWICIDSRKCMTVSDPFSQLRHSKTQRLAIGTARPTNLAGNKLLADISS